MEAYEIYELLKEELGTEDLLEAVYQYFGNWGMEPCLRSIASDYDIELEPEEEEEEEEIEEDDNSYKVNEERFKECLGCDNEMNQEMIIGFNDLVEAREYLKTYCYEEFDNLFEMLVYLNDMYFWYKNKFYIMLYEEAKNILQEEE